MQQWHPHGPSPQRRIRHCLDRLNTSEATWPGSLPGLSATAFWRQARQAQCPQGVLHLHSAVTCISGHILGANDARNGSAMEVLRRRVFVTPSRDHTRRPRWPSLDGTRTTCARTSTWSGDEDWEQQLGFNTRLQSQIFQSDYFRSMQHHVTNVESLVEEILTHADHAESYTPNSNNTMPSTLLCCVCRLAQLQPSKDQLRDLVGFRAAARTGSAYVRAVALLHLRFNCPPTEAWRWLRNFLFDTEVFRPTGGPTSVPMSMGDWVEHLLTDDKYYDTVLPRLPLGLKREMALELVQLPELRQAYSKHRCRFDQHRLIGARVRVLRGTTWHYAQVLSSCVMGRSLVVDVQLEDGSQEEVPCGLVRLQEPRPRGSWQRSRSPKLQGSPRTEEKLREEYLRRDREKAVTEDKNDYFKPIPKLKKMLMTKDQSLRNVAPDRVGVTPVVKLLKEPREPKEVHREPREAPRGETSSRQLLLEVVQKYSSGSAARHDRLEYHDWHRAVNSGNEVLAPETIRLG
ncbi:unnamed protein product [Durusdinium trenchii]|uniref:Pre-mRNA-splicing factor 38 n=1 Tax=Durusdinium trenchii TaxID=1381693 RepID=A0ABP0MI92_9DINO